MKRKFGLALAALALVTGGFAFEGSSLSITSEQRERDNFRFGKDALLQIRNDYQAGKYDSFLKEIDASYDQVKDQGQLADFVQLRQGSSQNLQWMEEVKGLQKAKNTQLVQAVSGQDTPFANKVRSVANFSSTEDQEGALSMLSVIHQMVPGSGENRDQNMLIDLDVEYEYKTVHLDMPGIPSDTRDLHYALKMEQMDKMLLASQSFEDISLKNAVESLSHNFDERLAQNWDLMDLHDLAKGKTKPADSVQERVVSVLQSHQEKMGDLARNYLN